MNEKERIAYLEQYQEKTHFYGRVGLSIGVLLLLAAPFAMGLSLNAMPDLSAFAKVCLRM